MTTADNNDSTPKESNQPDISGLKTELDSKLAEVQRQLQSMNESFAQNFQTLASHVAPKQEVQEDDLNLYDSKQLKRQVADVASTVAQEIAAKERELNSTIYSLAQEYPEIQTDTKVKQAVIEAHAKLPKSLQGTAQGYELAVSRAVAKEGILPASKRKQVDDDISAGARSQSRPQKGGGKAKVSEATMYIAQLLGRNTEDPEVVKGLEEAANRSSWSKYR